MTVRIPAAARPARRLARHRQHGVVMLFALIALALMLVGAVAVVRSMNASLSNAGNLGFKRDLNNQAERAVASAVSLLQSGALANETARRSSAPARNYSATMLPTNAQGLPLALVDDGSFGTVGSAGNDIAVAEQSVTVRWVLDRLCVNAGAPSEDHCTMTQDSLPVGGSGGGGLIAEDNSAGGPGAVGRQPAYRLSIRVTGPRRTQAYFQTTLTL